MRLVQWRRQTFRALQVRNYRLFFVGQVISRSGWWIQMVAENWLVVDLGGSGLVLGITSALQFAPLLLFSAYAGVLVDRRDTRKLLIATQCASGLLALIIGLLALTGVVQIWMIWLAAFLLGCLNAFEIPAREAFTMELAGPAHVTNAVALNNVVRNSSRAFGPALGGWLISWAGDAFQSGCRPTGGHERPHQHSDSKARHDQAIDLCIFLKRLGDVEGQQDDKVGTKGRGHGRDE